MTRICVLVGAVLLLAHGAAAQAPRVVNATVQERAVSGDARAFLQTLARQQAQAAWFGYAVPAVPGHQEGSCGDGVYYSGTAMVGCGPCYLEPRSSSVAIGAITNRTPDATPVVLEGDRTLFVLFRAERGVVNRVRLFSPGCPLDGGGLPFIWVTGVPPADSIAMLMTFAGDGAASKAGTSNLARNAITAIALHADRSADAALEQCIGTQQPLDTRKQAAFWLGAARGDRGYEVLSGVAEKDPSAQFRAQAVVGLGQNQAAGAVDILVRMARSDSDGSVRGQALFWLAERAGKKAVGTLTDAIENDPEAQVKERAVFALSRLPSDESVPLLIQLARTNRNSRVRQRAMFWLGQSKDERAIAFFEEVLKQGR